MIIKIKNKDTLIIENFELKCCVGKKGFKKNKVEGDNSTPKGIFGLGKLYWRYDRVKKPETRLECKKIKKNQGWCTDSRSKFYNKEFKIQKKYKHEKLNRKDSKYDLFIVINYNRKKVLKNKGSAIFIHLTKEYKPTAGCIALKKKDFLILCKLLNKKSKILII
tara:strand:+ start:1163 stop:1654 length:492 start_codon:yes stop_codon:yes gene_type:complete